MYAPPEALSGLLDQQARDGPNTGGGPLSPGQYISGHVPGQQANSTMSSFEPAAADSQLQGVGGEGGPGGHPSAALTPEMLALLADVYSVGVTLNQLFSKVLVSLSLSSLSLLSSLSPLSLSLSLFSLSSLSVCCLTQLKPDVLQAHTV